MICVVFYTLKIIWMSVFVLFYGVFYGVWITHAWCYMMRDSLYRCTEKVLWCIGKALWAYGKAYIGVRKRLYEDVIRAFSQRGKGFFALRERTDAVAVLSICWYTTVYAVSSKPTCYVAGFWICWYEMFDFIASKFAYTVAGRVVLVCARFSASWRYTVFLTISTIWCGYVKTVNIKRTLSFIRAGGQISPHDDNRSTREEKTSKLCIIIQSPLRY